MTKPVDAMTETEVLEALRRVARRLEATDRKLRAERLALYQRGRALGIPLRTLGEAAGRSNVTVHQELRQASA